MKNFILGAFALLLCSLNASAQSGGFLWVGSRSATGEAKAVQEAITSIYDAFSKGKTEKGLAYYSEEVTLVDPTGNIVFGKEAYRTGFEEAMKSMDVAPIMKYSNMQARLLTNDVALVVWDAEDEFKMGGQTINSKAKCSAVLRKANGTWKMEFAQLTPQQGMPALDAGSKN